MKVATTARTPQRWWMLTGVGSACVGAVAAIAHPVIGCVFASGFVGMRIATIAQQRRRRGVDYDAAFVTLLEAIAAHLRSGETITSALAAATPGVRALERDRDRVLRAYALGRPFATTLARWRIEHPSDAVVVGTVALAIAYTHGAAIASVLEHLAATVRDRALVRAELRLQATHARLSAYVISAAPLVFLVISAGLDPRFFGDVLRTDAGRVCVGLGLIFEAVGWWIMAVIVRGPVPRERRRDDALARDLPIVTDIVGVALGAGYPPITAIGFVRAWCPPETGSAFETVHARLDAGDSLAQALASGTTFAPALAPVLRVLLAAANGAPVQTLITRLADDARHQVKARAAARARTVPIRLLFPLVLCILPAFALLTVAPAVISGVRGIQ